MATIKKRGNSYLIRCYDGYDQTGRQIERTMTWKIPAGMTEKKAEKEARHQAELFEEKVRTGQSAEQKAMKFAAFAEKWFQDYAATQLRPRTIDGYKHLMQRVYPSIGHLYIDKIRPAHLVQFYRELSETKKATTYHFNGDLKQLLKASGLNMTSFAKKSGVPLSAVKSAANGNNINLQNASLIASGLNKTVNELFTASNSEEVLSPNTVGKYHRVLSSMFQTAVEWGMIVSNPCDRVSPPKVKKADAPFLTAEEAIRLLSLLENEPQQYRNAVTLLLFTGMRRGELLGLEWSDYDKENRLLNISKTMQYLPDRGVFQDDTKNESSNRVIKLSQTAANALNAQRIWQLEQQLKTGSYWKQSNKIFTNPCGDPIHPDTLSGWFHDFIARTDLPPIHLHSLRHTNATLQIANGSSVTTVAGYLGHANAGTTTKVYAHAIQSAQAAAAELLEDILTPSKQKAARKA